MQTNLRHWDSAETAESFEAIKAQVKEMKKVIEKIAIECYDKES